MSLLTAVFNDSFTMAYIEAMLWSSNDDDDTPLDSNYDLTDLTEEALQKCWDDCQKFKQENAALLLDEFCKTSDEYDAMQRGGHDFWLTRNGHGCGFWDGDWEKEVGEKLTEASKKFGELFPFVTDYKQQIDFA